MKKSYFFELILDDFNDKQTAESVADAVAGYLEEKHDLIEIENPDTTCPSVYTYSDGDKDDQYRVECSGWVDILMSDFCDDRTMRSTLELIVGELSERIGDVPGSGERDPGEVTFYEGMPRSHVFDI